jgi:hypothetical protein
MPVNAALAANIFLHVGDFNFNMKRFTLALFVTCVAGTIAVAAPDDPQSSEHHKRRDPAKMFSRADQNADGKISLEEFLAQRGRRGNRQETATAEQKAKHEERRTAMFKRLDANSDGFVTTEEFQAFAAKHGRGHKPADQQQQ